MFGSVDRFGSIDVPVRSARLPGKAPRLPARFIGRSGICANNGTDSAPPEFWGRILRLATPVARLQGPRTE
eukprot:15430797-Alexandrium_andersonii.AAC.1